MSCVGDEVLGLEVAKVEPLAGPLTLNAMCRPSYIEGRLRLAENRERQRGKGAALTSSTPPDGAPTPEERAAAEKAAEANMARLLQEEDAAKVSFFPLHR